MRETVRKEITKLMEQNMSSWQIANKTGLKESSAKEYMRQIQKGATKTVKHKTKRVPAREPLLYDEVGDRDGFCYTITKIDNGIIYVKRNDLTRKMESKVYKIKYSAFMKGETKYRLKNFAPVKVILPVKTVATSVGDQVCFNI